jgi:hypothetical protein
MVAARNVAIILGIAAAVYFLPGGGNAAAIVYAVLGTLILVSLALLAVRFYREHQTDVYGLGDRWRVVLYVALAAAVLAMAARARLVHTGVGTLVWIAVIGAASYAVYLCWRRYSEYG